MENCKPKPSSPPNSKPVPDTHCFDIDAENDPPTIELAPGNVDYLKEKTYSKFKNYVANMVGKRFLNELLRDNKLIIKEIRGM